MAGLLATLLSGIDSTKRTVKNRLSDLVSAPGGYLEMLNDQANTTHSLERWKNETSARLRD